MFEKLKGKKQISITLDVELIERLENLYKKMKVKSLAPFINEILWNWLKEEEKKIK